MIEQNPGFVALTENYNDAYLPYISKEFMVHTLVQDSNV